jgi:hypothetical protein
VAGIVRDGDLNAARERPGQLRVRACPPLDSQPCKRAVAAVDRADHRRLFMATAGHRPERRAADVANIVYSVSVVLG